MPLNAEVLGTPGLPTVRLTASDLPNGPGRLTVEENLVPNPSGRATDGNAVLWENTLPNPRGRWTNGTVVVVDNFDGNESPDPDLTLEVDGDVKRLVAPKPVGWNGDPAYSRVYYSHTRDAIALLPNADGTSQYIYTAVDTTPATTVLYIETADGNPASVSAHGNGASAKTVPSGGTYYGVKDDRNLLIVSVGAESRGRTVYFRAALVPGTYSGPYFDGNSTSTDSDLSYEWAGGEHTSASRLVAPQAVGYRSYRGVTFYSRKHDAVAFMPTDVDDPSQAYTQIIPGVDLVSGKNYTMYTEAWTDSPTARAFRSYIIGGGGSHYIYFDNGRAENRHHFTLNGSGSTVAMNASVFDVTGIQNGDIVYFRTVIAPGEYTGPYSDGSTRSREFSTEWTGQPNASTSRIYVDVPEDMAYRISAEYDGGTYTVASGTLWDHISQLVVADPQAPLGTPVRYSMRVGTLRWDSEPVTRSYDGWDVITDASGKNRVEVLREKGDERAYSPREYVADVPGRAVGPARYGPTAGAPTGAMTVRADAENSARLHELIMANRPVIYLHNHSGNRCMLKNCDVGLSQTIFVTSVSNNLAANMHFAERIWGLDYRPADDKSPHRESPVATFDELTDAYYSFTALQSDNETFDDVRSGDFLI